MRSETGMGTILRESDGTMIGRRRYSLSSNTPVIESRTFGWGSGTDDFTETDLYIEWEGSEAVLLFDEQMRGDRPAFVLKLKDGERCIEFAVMSNSGAVRASGELRPCDGR